MINAQMVAVIAMSRSSLPMNIYCFGKKFKGIERKSLIAQGSKDLGSTIVLYGTFSNRKTPVQDY